METPRILVTDRKIGNMNELVPILEGLVQSKDPLLIIAVYAADDPRTPTRDPATQKRTRGTGTTALARRGRRYARAAARQCGVAFPVRPSTWSSTSSCTSSCGPKWSSKWSSTSGAAAAGAPLRARRSPRSFCRIMQRFGIVLLRYALI